MSSIRRFSELRITNLFAALLLVLVLASATGGCATSDKSRSLVITGETLDAVGQQFVQTGRLYDRLLDAEKITKDEYRDWANYAKRFQLIYPEAVQAWTAGRSTDDTIDLILRLKSQLLEFYTYARSR